MNVCAELFTGIGGMAEGLRRAVWEHAFFAESDEWRRGILERNFPGVPCYEDVRLVGEPAGRTAADGHRAPANERRRETGPGLPGGVDLLTGGFPCQDLSVAGRRTGLAGNRSGLFFEFARVAETLRPRFVLVENVPGLLSSQGGRDFGCVLGTLADLGYGVAWRILDSRFFGVPQRRRRVFVLGVLAERDPRAAAERAGQILAVGSRCDRHLAKGGEAGSDVAESPISGPLTRRYGKGVNSTMDDGAMIAAPLSHGSNPNSNAAGRRREDPVSEQDSTPAWGKGNKGNKGGTASIGIADGQTVRRLTPTECCRLQGLPDDWFGTPNEPPDSPRYAGLGDAVTVPVAEWLGRRILEAA